MYKVQNEFIPFMIMLEFNFYMIILDRCSELNDSSQAKLVLNVNEANVKYNNCIP